MKIARVTATPLNVPLHIKLVGVDRKTSLACLPCRGRDRRRPGRPRPHQHHRRGRDRADRQRRRGPGDHRRRSARARAHLGQALLDADAARADRLCRACARRDRRGAVGHQGQGAEPAGVAAARRRASRACRSMPPSASASSTASSLPPPPSSGSSQGFKRLKMTVGNEALRHRDSASADGRDPRGRRARARGARGGRAGRRAVHRRQLQSRSLSRAPSWSR